MEDHIQDSILMIRRMVGVYMFGRMVPTITANGRMENNMVKVDTSLNSRLDMAIGSRANARNGSYNRNSIKR
jgi:hypothetical protein